jgi:hypothetical protein
VTAINIVQTDNAVHMCTDGASYLVDGTLAGFGTKTFVAPHLPLVLATRGPAGAAFDLGRALSFGKQSFDDVVGAIEDDLPRVCGADPLEIIFAGWSERSRKCEAYFIRANDAAAPASVAAGFEIIAEPVLRSTAPFKLVRLEALATSPLLPADQAECKPKSSRFDQLCSYAIKVMEAQRAMLFADWSGEHVYRTVGGFVQLTTLTRDDISQRIIHRWPQDRVGMKIGAA